MLELVTTVICPINRMPLRLFRHVDTGEGAVIGGELAVILGYRSLTHVLRAYPDYNENIHCFLLRGASLRQFKDYLVTQNIRAYRRASSLCLLSETGAAFLFGRHCKEQAVRVGEWLLGDAFPLLRPHPFAGYQRIFSHYLNCEFCVFLWRGRFGVLFSHIFALLGVPHPDHVTRALHGYVLNLHIDSWPEPSQEGVARPDDWQRHEAFLFYPSGLYRYWNCSRHPLFSLMRLCFEREVWPQCRRGAWVTLPAETEETNSDRQSAQLCAMEPVPDYPHADEPDAQLWSRMVEEMIGRRTEPLTQAIQSLESRLRQWNDGSMTVLQQYADRLQTLDGRQNGLLQEWREQTLRLFARLDGLRDMCSMGGAGSGSMEDEAKAGVPVAADENLSLAFLKELARTLRIYYLDRQTPHLVFVRALVVKAGSREVEVLRRLMNEELRLKPGENQVDLDDNTYRIWLA